MYTTVVDVSAIAANYTPMRITARLDPRTLSSRGRIAGVILFLCYFAAVQLGGILFTAPAVLSPSAGVALAGLYLGGVALWPAILLGAFFSSFISGSGLFSLFLVPIAATLQAIAGAYILREFNFDPIIRRLRDVFLIIGVAFTVSAIIPTFGYLAFYINTFFGGSMPANLSWGSWWTGNILSLLIVAPLIIRWYVKPLFTRTWRELAETIFVIFVLASFTWLLFFTSIGRVGEISLIYFLLIPLFWTAIRFGPRFTITNITIVAFFALAGTFYGPHASVDVVELGRQLFQIEIFIIILALIFYIITALQEERRGAVKDLTSYISQLEIALNQLSMQDRAKSDFVAILAHELRNPLAPIVSTLELLRLNMTHTEESIGAINLMDDHLKTVQRLLDDLLDVSRISKSKLDLKKEEVELRSIIERSIQSIERYLKMRNQTLVLDISREPLVLVADPVRIEQIVNNLLSNASKFTPEGGRIAITTKRDGNTAFIRVEDSGIGIDPKMLERIFEPFTQLGTNRMQDGLGIGLSLTQKLVEMHGGTIQVYSAGEGRGSDFTVRLPLLPTFSTPPVRNKAPTTSAKNSASTISKVLIVDDNTAAAQGIGKLLEHKGYEVAYAYTGEDACTQAQAFLPSAIVLDIGLPDMTGYEVAKRLRNSIGFEGVLIALTGYGQDEDKQRAREAGFNHHLTKPISINDLEASFGSE